MTYILDVSGDLYTFLTWVHLSAFDLSYGKADRYQVYMLSGLSML